MGGNPGEVRAAGNDQIARSAQERSITTISKLYRKRLAEAYRKAYAAVRGQMSPEYGIVTTGRGKLLREAISNFLTRSPSPLPSSI